jgi:predicted RNase H-like nuclease (RuvC/YqgF family)
MDASQLRELATNALTGYWPAHLGLKTDAERIEYLARCIETAADEIQQGDEAFEQVTELETKTERLQNEIDEQAAEIESLKARKEG